MLRKNKLSVFLLAVLVMLTVYYANQERSDLVNGGDPIDTNSRYVEYATKRISLTEERTSRILELEASISNADDILDINEALEKLEAIEYLTIQEIILEDTIISLGYDDCLVVITNDTLDIDILANVFNIDEFITVCDIVQSNFDYNVEVKIKLSKTGV